MEAGSAHGPGEGRGLDEASVAELVKRLGEQTSTLARQEVELAKAELTEKVADDTMDVERAIEVATWLFRDNPARLFSLSL